MNQVLDVINLVKAVLIYGGITVVVYIIISIITPVWDALVPVFSFLYGLLSQLFGYIMLMGPVLTEVGNTLTEIFNQIASLGKVFEQMPDKIASLFS
jgi:phage-related protein